MVIVTGANSGIGKALAVELARRGKLFLVKRYFVDILQSGRFPIRNIYPYLLFNYDYHKGEYILG